MIRSTFLIYINGILLYIIFFIYYYWHIIIYINNIPSTIPGMGTGKVALQLFLSTPTPRHVYGVELAPSRWRLAWPFTTKVRSHGSHSELACGELNLWTIQSWSVYTTHHVLTSEIILGIFHVLVGGFWLSHPLGILDESKMSVCVVFFLCAAFNPRSALRWPNIPLDHSLITDMRFSHFWVESGKK